MKTIKLDKWKDLPENYTGVVDWDDLIFYYLNGKLHRTDGPAFIWSNGDIEYYLNGKRHREDGPAIIRKDGNMYYINHINITKEVKDWIKENNIPEIWNNSHKILFKLTFG